MIVVDSIVIEGGIFVSHGIWLFRTRKVRVAAKAAGRSFDDLPESETYHVDVARKGSIAASRDIEHIEVERRGSVASARDLEAGIPNRRRSMAKDVVQEEDGVRSGCKGVTVKEDEVRASFDGQGVSEVDYGTMDRKADSRKRPGCERQDTGASLFPGRNPEWGATK